jgi:probable phosphoglycerate mutase
MPSPVIYYIRHGETAWNAAGRFQGSQDIPLNDLGRVQAAQAGTILERLLANDDRKAADLHYVASPLGRARSTMELVRGQLALAPDVYALDDRLREIGYGLWEGSTLAQQEESHPEVFASRQLDKWTVSPPQGESYAALLVRVRDWYDSLTGDTVAVAHGGTARGLMVALGVQSMESAVDLTIEQGAVYVFGPNGLAKYT